MRRKTVHINFQMDPILDRDILNFLRMQENKTRFFRKLVRTLIGKYGNKDLSILPVDEKDLESMDNI